MPQLADILGQEAVVQLLRRAIAADKLAQSYLFTGPEGVGKATTARALAAALNCLERPGQGCGVCRPCRLIAGGVHPDLFELSPDGAYIKIDQVRALESHLGYPPHEARFRVVILDGAERLNLNAANALLKSVEEPRPRTLFVLITAAVHRVIPTLISRCQRVRFTPLSTAVILEILQAQEAGAATARGAAAALSEGSVTRALRLLQEDQLAVMQATIERLLAAARSGDPLAIFAAASEAGRERQQLVEMLELLRARLRDLLLVVEGLEQERLINADQLPQLRAEAQQLSYRTVLGYLEAVDRSQSALLGNVNPALTIERLVLEMHQVAFP